MLLVGLAMLLTPSASADSCFGVEGGSGVECVGLHTYDNTSQCVGYAYGEYGCTGVWADPQNQNNHRAPSQCQLIIWEGGIVLVPDMGTGHTVTTNESWVCVTEI